ncbi:hypothetical protein BDZ94DRAFT_1274176 [Collybia nuda]|uniref:REJ domain-containing protein n=1 Tax=Collybia nuda TaxID=64659 RepID=A0A9P6C9E3_9AGAR|nr:hypothetical protein BDZ94DRAFT_1274176 [Collybia nuda]
MKESVYHKRQSVSVSSTSNITTLQSVSSTSTSLPFSSTSPDMSGSSSSPPTSSSSPNSSSSTSSSSPSSSSSISTSSISSSPISSSSSMTSPIPDTSSMISSSTTPLSTSPENTATSSKTPVSTRETPPTTTFHTTFLVTTTDRRGDITTSAPSTVTSIIVSTASDGLVITVTEVQVNHQQTLSPDNNNSNKSSFFRNTGAVAGVFVLVGLAAASILLWIFFAVRRRRRTQRLEHDTAVSATLAAVGFHRTPLDDDDDHVNSSRRSRLDSAEMNQRSSSGFANGTISSIPSGGRVSAYMDSPHPDDQDAFNPYTDYVVPPGARDGYISGRTSSPPPVAFYNGPYRERTGSGSAGEHVISHSASHSAGSYEPLLASFHQPQGSSQSQHPGSSSTPRSPQRLSDAKSSPFTLFQSASPELNLGDNFGSGHSSLYSSGSIGDDRLDPGLRQRLQEVVDRASVKDLRDDEDYSRPVLGVRNLPDAAPHSSHES